MYRHYEDIGILNEMLKEARDRYDSMNEDDDVDALVDAYLEVSELEDRIRFAWDDEEYDEMYE